MSSVVWRLLQNRLPTKMETANHVLFNCPVLSVCRSETLKWKGVSVALLEGGVDNLRFFKGLMQGDKE
ncbi:hypothetical protein A2U01_0052830, partial [Trifolium medium]|nr:hypothetical protein [Trifolium medium]